jgi:hypothetical protein
LQNRTAINLFFPYFLGAKSNKNAFFSKLLLPTLQAGSPHAAVFCFAAEAPAGQRI